MTTSACASPNEAADRAAIDRLHQRDMDAVKASTADSLIALWSEGIVALPPGGEIQRNRAEMEAALRRGLAESNEKTETLEYVLAFEEVKIVGGYAWEYGTVRGRTRDRATGAETEYAGKLMRILIRGEDGEWRVHRTIWN